MESPLETRNFVEDALAATPHNVADWFSQSAISSGVVRVLTRAWNLCFFVFVNVLFIHNISLAHSIKFLSVPFKESSLYLLLFISGLFSFYVFL